jgi:hypothetical protein
MAGSPASASIPFNIFAKDSGVRNRLPMISACLCLLLSAPIDADEGERQVIVARVDNDGVQRVRIIGGEYFFKPQRVVVKANIPVELSLSKEASVAPHTFVIHAPEAGIVLDEELSTDIKKVAFTPAAVGSYPYYCRNRLLLFKSHRDKGMEGVLEVTP